MTLPSSGAAAAPIAGDTFRESSRPRSWPPPPGLIEPKDLEDAELDEDDVENLRSSAVRCDSACFETEAKSFEDVFSMLACRLA